MEISQRSKIDPFIVMDIMERAQSAEQAGQKVVHLEVGQPGTPAPKIARELLKSFMTKNPMGYTVALGLTDLRKKIAELYGLWYGLDIDWNRIIITSGSSAGFVLAFTALFDNFAKVALANPGYPSYRQIMKALSIEPVLINGTEENKFQPTIMDLLSLNIKGLLIASPGNPTGCMIDREPLRELVDYCEEKKISFISDEIYHGIQYEKKAVSALEVTDECYVVNSFSKFFSMTGWRVGWMVVPENHIRVVERLAQNLFICSPHVSQVAALEALSCEDELLHNLDIYRENRQIINDELLNVGLDNFAPPDGAFYFYVDISKHSSDSLSFCSDILEEVGVAITPGVDFDPERGKTTIRISYARSTEEITEGMKRISQFMKKRGYF